MIDENNIIQLPLDEVARFNNQMSFLEERIAELEFSTEDRGWQRLGNTNDYELDILHLKQIVARARIFFLHNPLINRAVSLQADYVFAQGLNIVATDKKINPVIQKFIDDSGNQRELTGHQARLEKEQTLMLDGNVFLVLFTKKQDDGFVSVRSVIVDEITNIITNPDDSNEVWYYQREWSSTPLSGGTVINKRLYPDINYDPQIKPANLNSIDIDWNAPIYHVKVGALAKSRFGVPEVYCALDWADAHRNFLQDWATIVRMYARWALQLKVPGGKSAVAAAKTKLGDTITSDNSVNRNPATIAGGIFTTTKEGAELSVLKTSGATTSAQDGREIRMMVAAALGIPDCYDSETEVLTEQGFMRHDEWKPGIRVACYNPDTQLIEWHEPEELRAFYYNGDMIQFKHQQVDVLVTPHHRMWTAPAVQWNMQPAGATAKVGRRSVADGGVAQVDRSWRIETAQHIMDNPRSYGWKLTNAVRMAEPEDDLLIDSPLGVVESTTWARFIGYWISEGHASSIAQKYNDNGIQKSRVIRRIGISQLPGPVLDDMRDVLDTLGQAFTEDTHPTSGVHVLVIQNKELWDWLRDNCGINSHNKHLPESVFGINEYTWSNAMREALYQALMDGDGGRSGGSFRYSTVSKRLADDMQLLAISLGYGASITSDFTNYNGKKHACYRVWIRTRSTDVSHIKPKHVSKVVYSGMIYCFRLKYGLYVTRRNNKIAILGNTFFGDVDVGNLATARTLDRPTELKYRSRQQLWMAVYNNILNYVVRWSILAPKGPLKALTSTQIGPDGRLTIQGQENFDTHIEVMFPPILEHSIKDRIDAVTEAVTLNGKTFAVDSPELEQLTIRLMLQALGIPDVDEIVKKIFDAIVQPQPQAPPNNQMPGNIPSAAPGDTQNVQQ